jgi:hypothetical protein
MPKLVHHEVQEAVVTTLEDVARWLDEGWTLLHMDRTAGRWRCVWVRII